MGILKTNAMHWSLRICFSQRTLLLLEHIGVPVRVWGVNRSRGKSMQGQKISSTNLLKEHYVDPRCISKNPLAKPLGYYYLQKKVRCHNRQIHKMTIAKGGYRKLN